MRGRSDATLNPGGVRIGTAEIYQQVEDIDFDYRMFSHRSRESICKSNSILLQQKS